VEENEPKTDARHGDRWICDVERDQLIHSQFVAKIKEGTGSTTIAGRIHALAKKDSESFS
jgi:hypothetical protein